MSEFVPMSRETFNEHLPEIGAILNVLIVEREQGDRRRSRVRRKLAVHELGGRGDVPIGEVFNMPFGDIFVSRMSKDDEKGHRDDEPDDRQSKFRAPEPITGDLDDSFEMSSRRGRFKLSARAVIESIEQGRQRIFIPAGKFTRFIDED